MTSSLKNVASTMSVFQPKFYEAVMASLYIDSVEKDTLVKQYQRMCARLNDAVTRSTGIMPVTPIRKREWQRAADRRQRDVEARRRQGA